MTLNPQSNISSPQELKAIIVEVRRYAHWYAQNSVKLHVTGNGSTEQFVISPTAIELIKDWSVQKPLSEKSLDELIATLENYESKAPRLTITLAAVPPNDLKKTLVEWCREHVAPNVLVDFRFNSTLLGGMVVRYGSHVYDWSFRRQILAARDRFPEVLRRV